MTEKQAARLVEVVSLLLILGVGIAIAIPKYFEMQRAEEGARVLQDVEVVRRAVFAFYSDSAFFPAEEPGELAPLDLLPYLPPNFSFTRSYGTLLYRNWPTPVRDSTAGADQVVGLSVTVRDPRIGAQAEAQAQGTARFAVGNRFTFVFFGS
jgi:hypothetical protein